MSIRPAVLIPCIVVWVACSFSFGISYARSETIDAYNQCSAFLKGMTAQAIEARRAAAPKSDAVHESAVAKGDAP